MLVCNIKYVQIKKLKKKKKKKLQKTDNIDRRCLFCLSVYPSINQNILIFVFNYVTQLQTVVLYTTSP